jgi:ABC-type branched-subunit amino acid transport system ATPase component/ABC-type branched-subunit amino acid transport system permease subunit
MSGTISVLGLHLNASVFIIGLTTGLTYSLLAMGIVLIYRTSRVLNFAQGDLGALLAGFVPWLVGTLGLNYWLGLGVALSAAICAGIVLEILIIRRLAKAPRVIVLVATIACAQGFYIISLFVPVGDSASATFPIPFDLTWTIGSTQISPPEVLILITVPIACLALAAFFRFTRLGLASRAAVDNPEAALTAGVPIRRISMFAWIVAAVLAAVAGILVGPLQSVVQRTEVGPDLLERAIAAAMIGGLTSFTGALAGGILVGLVEAIVLFNYPSQGTVDLVLFVLVIIILLARRSNMLARRGGGVVSEDWSSVGSVKRLDPAIARQFKVRLFHGSALSLYLLIAIVVGLVTSPSIQDDLSGGFLFAIMALSLVVLTGYCGQISIGQSAFVAIGALAGGRLAQFSGINWWLGLVLASCVGGLIALIAGMPALRVRGIYLAIVTLAFATMASTWLFAQPWLVNVNEYGESSTQLQRPGIGALSFSGEQAYYFLSLVALILAAGATWLLRTSRLGRQMIAVRENELVAESQGISAMRVKLIAFTLSGVLASLGGYLYGGLLIDFSDQSIFAPALALTIVSMAIIGGVTTVSGAILGGVALVGIGDVIQPLFHGTFGTNLILILGSVGLLLVVLQNPRGMSDGFFRNRDWALRRLGLAQPPAAGMPASAAAADGEPEPDPVLRGSAPLLAAIAQPAAERVLADSAALEVRAVSVEIGGLPILQDVSISAMRGEIVGLIGANGAGKSTLFDVIGGQLSPKSGRILLNEHDVTRQSPWRRAQHGLGRSFQQARLYPNSTVYETLLVAADRATRAPGRLAPRWGQWREPARKAEEILELMGLTGVSNHDIRELSTGTRRIVELATIVCLGSRVMLLDEPTAGVAQREVEAFRPVLTAIRDRLDATLLVIEHDFPTLASIADRMYVLDAGLVIAEGPPALLRDDQKVISAYLGVDEAAIARSDSIA